MPRPHVSVFLGLSLDGFIAGEGGDVSWLEPFTTDPPEATGYTALMREVDTLVIGRGTYDVVLGLGPWPYDGKRVVVLTHRPLSPHHGEERFDGPLPALLSRLAAQGCGHVYLDGGAAVRQGLSAGVVDRLTLSWVPVVLGRGIPLFGPELPRIALRLEGSQRLPSGLVQARYAPVPVGFRPQTT